MSTIPLAQVLYVQVSVDVLSCCFQWLDTMMMTLLCACLHLHWFCKIPLGMSRHTFGSSPCEYRVYVYIILSSCRTPTPLINPQQCTLIQSLVRTSSLSHHYWILLHVTTSCTVHHVLLVFTIWFCWFLSSAGRLMGTSYGCSREESVLWGRLVVLIRMSWAKMERREARRLFLLLATSMAAHCVGVWRSRCSCHLQAPPCQSCLRVLSFSEWVWPM